MISEILVGDCLEVMKSFPDNHFTGIVTDPPYGLSFMGKGWDYEVPDSLYWKECLRIAKPGSFLIAMGGTRTFHRLTCAIEDGGFYIRDVISWIYASGFPKSHNNFGIAGYGTSLKPAWEPCVLAMKPLDGTFKENLEKWGHAGLNIGECRIGSHSYSQKEWTKKGMSRITANTYSKHQPSDSTLPKGRWPANLILDEEAGRMLDEQSGVCKTGNLKPYKRSTEGGFHGSFGDYDGSRPASSGGASRFFYCAKASSRERNEGLEGLPDHEESIHLNGGPWKENSTSVSGKQKRIPRKNNHPTVKPLALMQYLIKLISPPQNDLILDPFAGSGTTILAAKRLGISAIGIEKSPEYAEIARKRVDSYIQKSDDPDLFDDFLQKISSNV